VLLVTLRNHLYDFSNVCEGFFFGVTPSGGALLDKRGCIGMPAVLVGLDDDRKM
jgi:hypothetical protein